MVDAVRHQPIWRVVLRRHDGEYIPVHMPADELALNDIVDRVKDEAADCRDRWQHLHDFKSALARLQSIYAMTVHTSQGSTFSHVFLDVPDIRKRERDNLLECQQRHCQLKQGWYPPTVGGAAVRCREVLGTPIGLPPLKRKGPRRSTRPS
jgi:UvrD-like helicase C-terminal domain